MPPFGRRRRAIGLASLATGVVCPCHALVGLASVAMGGQILSPAAQDGLHAVYVPFAVLAGALLLRYARVAPAEPAEGTEPAE